MDAAMLIENNSWIFTSDIQLVIKILAIEAEEDKGSDGGEGKLEAGVACQEGAGSISQVKGDLSLFISHPACPAGILHVSFLVHIHVHLIVHFVAFLRCIACKLLITHVTLPMLCSVDIFEETILLLHVVNQTSDPAVDVFQLPGVDLLHPILAPPCQRNQPSPYLLLPVVRGGFDW